MLEPLITVLLHWRADIEPLRTFIESKAIGAKHRVGNNYRENTGILKHLALVLTNP